MKSNAIVLERPEHLSLESLELTAPGDDDLLVEVDWSGISTGTERLLWNGRMPAFPGMGYPLVPGYESVGHVIHAGAKAGHAVGDTVFVPEEMEKSTFLQTAKDWTLLLYQLGLGAAGIGSAIR